MKRYSEKIYKELHRVIQAGHDSNMPIDESMGLLVAALRCLNFKVDVPRGVPLQQFSQGSEKPWVDIAPEPARTIERELFAQVERSAIDPQSQEFSKIINEANMAGLPEQERLLQLLDEFYAERNIPINIHLIVVGMRNFRLMCQGAKIMKLPEKADEYPQWFHAAQAEMQAFAEFLCTKVKE